MNAKELISDLRRAGPQELAVIFHFVADRLHSLRLMDGQRINDQIDFAVLLRELGEAARISPENPESTEVQSAAVSRTSPLVTSICMKCYHVHEKEGECGVDLGKGGRCDCRAELSA